MRQPRLTYTQAQVDYVKNIAHNTSIDKILELYIAKYPEHADITKNQIKQLMVRRGIKTGLRHKYNNAAKHKLLNEEQEKYFIAHNLGKSSKEMIELMAEIGVTLTPNQVKQQRSRLKLDSGLTGRWVKGQKAWNKGLKIPIPPNSPQLKTVFKKGNIPHNHLPIGSEVETKDGYTLVKIKDDYKVKKKENWQLKHRLIWEQYHQQKVPDGYCVIFLDRNKKNFDIANLMLVSQAEHQICNVRKLFETNDGDINKTQVLMLRLKNTIKEKQKGE